MRTKPFRIIRITMHTLPPCLKKPLGPIVVELAHHLEVLSRDFNGVVHNCLRHSEVVLPTSTSAIHAFLRPLAVSSFSAPKKCFRADVVEDTLKEGGKGGYFARAEQREGVVLDCCRPVRAVCV
jgi:hypothetical protein